MSEGLYWRHTQVRCFSLRYVSFSKVRHLHGDIASEESNLTAVYEYHHLNAALKHVCLARWNCHVTRETSVCYPSIFWDTTQSSKHLSWSVELKYMPHAQAPTSTVQLESKVRSQSHMRSQLHAIIIKIKIFLKSWTLSKSGMFTFLDVDDVSSPTQYLADYALKSGMRWHWKSASIRHNDRTNCTVVLHTHSSK